MDEIKIPENPLNRIALSLSGGGYRAASFHLGSMSYLNKLQFKGKPLLENVKMISTVSGGTITGVVYALMAEQKKDFSEFYHFLLSNLQELDLIKTGIEKLNPETKLENSNKSKNLINAFSEQYDKHFTRGTTLGDLEAMASHLEQVVFNATEFNNAINFRFKNPQQYSKSGNKKIHVSTGHSREIKLADVIASSSCFPGGFEPMLWPKDFRHTNSPLLEALHREMEDANLPPIGIMDGGIYDNQGIDSILNYKKSDELPYFDLVIISDVASPDMKPYLPFKEEEKKPGWQTLTLKQIHSKAISYNKKASWILATGFLLFILLPLIQGYKNNILTGISITIAILFAVLYFTKSIIIKKYRKTKATVLKAITARLPQYYLDKLASLKIEELSIHRIQPLIMARLLSLVSLLMDVFLKVVRRLNYYKLYDDKRYAYRRTSNLIKELTQDDWNKNPKGDYQQIVGPAIQKVAEEAAAFGTTYGLPILKNWTMY